MSTPPEVDDPPSHGTADRAVPGSRTAPASEAVSTDLRWQRRYAALVRTSDITLVCAVVAMSVALGAGLPTQAFVGRLGSGVLAAAMLIIGLRVLGAWEPRVLGTGPTEIRRVSKVFTASAVILALIGLGLDVTSTRPWVFGVIPGCWALCLVARYGLRKFLHHERGLGRCRLDVLAVGTPEAVADLVRRTQRDAHFGWRVTAACTSTGMASPLGGTIEGVPVVGDLDDVVAMVRASRHHVVAVSSSAGWGPGRLRELAWDLEETCTELAVDPGLMEIAGPRLHITPVDGLPLLRLTQPRFSGLGKLVKDGIDRTAAVLLLVLFAPALLAIAVAVRADGGPVFYRQERVGLGSRRFRMVKFRSMCVGADRMQADLVSDTEGTLFKMRRDPRVTRVGAFLRKYSLDELPQLFNVLGGSMSMVGPRPPLPREVATYGPDAERRLLVRPGITGLWQVSGRSDLSWDESVRLDLRYVENWSIALDALIVWKTIGAVATGRGAY